MVAGRAPSGRDHGAAKKEGKFRKLTLTSHRRSHLFHESQPIQASMFYLSCAYRLISSRRWSWSVGGSPFCSPQKSVVRFSLHSRRCHSQEQSLYMTILSELYSSVSDRPTLSTCIAAVFAQAQRAMLWPWGSSYRHVPCTPGTLLERRGTVREPLSRWPRPRTRSQTSMRGRLRSPVPWCHVTIEW